MTKLFINTIDKADPLDFQGRNLLNRIEIIRNVIDEIETGGTEEEKSQLAAYLDSFRERIRIRAMSEPEQLNAIAAAALTNDRNTIRVLLQSQYESVRSWAAESLRPRAPQWPRLTL